MSRACIYINAWGRRCTYVAKREGYCVAHQSKLLQKRKPRAGEVMRGHRVVKIDASQPAIVAALREHGWSVHSTAMVGGGFPDLLVGAGRVNVLLEVKTPGPPSTRALTTKELSFHASWSGPVAVVTTPEEAVLAVEMAVAEANPGSEGA